MLFFDMRNSINDDRRNYQQTKNDTGDFIRRHDRFRDQRNSIIPAYISSLCVILLAVPFTVPLSALRFTYQRP